MTTPSNGIPYVPENTHDPAAGLNVSLNVLDALLQTFVLDTDLTAPPGSPADGELHIVAASATGAWAGQANNLARFVSAAGTWQFYAAGDQIRFVFNVADGGLYVWHSGAWVRLAQVTPQGYGFSFRAIAKRTLPACPGNTSPPPSPKRRRPPTGSAARRSHA
jgi:hypothetical protein